jgi:hypothetical protein
MKVIDLDGHISTWNYVKDHSKNLLNKSKLHCLAREILKDQYPTMPILEEVTIRPRKNLTAYLDFYIPMIKLCVEVHGEQHYKFIPFYHTNILGFTTAKKRDTEKKEWCSINNLNYVALPYNETDKWLEYVQII